MTDAREFYRNQAAVVRRSLPNDLNQIQDNLKKAQKAAHEKFDAVPGGRKKAEKEAKAQAKEVLLKELSDAEEQYETDYENWYTNHHKK